jgi:hypothetical protein
VGECAHHYLGELCGSGRSHHPAPGYRHRHHGRVRNCRRHDSRMDTARGEPIGSRELRVRSLRATRRSRRREQRDTELLGGTCYEPHRDLVQHGWRGHRDHRHPRNPGRGVDRDPDDPRDHDDHGQPRRHRRLYGTDHDRRHQPDELDSVCSDAGLLQRVHQHNGLEPLRPTPRGS